MPVRSASRPRRGARATAPARRRPVPLTTGGERAPPGGSADPALGLPRVTLEQWRALVAIVDAGGHAQAAQALHKSQSSITAAVHKLQATLGLRAFEVEGRKAVLTPAGRMLY